MKKLLIIFSIMSIILSMSLLYSSDKGMYYCEGPHDSSSPCATCFSPHLESIYDPSSVITNIILIPTFLGEIFFKPINISTINVVVTFDRPPALLS